MPKPGAQYRVLGRRILASTEAPSPPAHTARAKHTAGHKDTWVGTGRGHHPVALPQRGGHPTHGCAPPKGSGPVLRCCVPPGRPLLLMLPSNLATALRRKLDDHAEVRMG